jgi:hypothetical protein
MAEIVDPLSKSARALHFPSRMGIKHFKVKDKIILIHTFIDPKVNQISNDNNPLITYSIVFIVELIVSLNLNVQLEMLFAICAIKFE